MYGKAKLVLGQYCPFCVTHMVFYCHQRYTDQLIPAHTDWENGRMNTWQQQGLRGLGNQQGKTTFCGDMRSWSLDMPLIPPCLPSWTNSKDGMVVWLFRGERCLSSQVGMSTSGDWLKISARKWTMKWADDWTEHSTLEGSHTARETIIKFRVCGLSCSHFHSHLTESFASLLKAQC